MRCTFLCLDIHTHEPDRAPECFSSCPVLELIHMNQITFTVRSFLPCLEILSSYRELASGIRFSGARKKPFELDNHVVAIYTAFWLDEINAAYMSIFY